MLHLKTDPAGIDQVIQRKQCTLFNNLLTSWGVTEATYQSYGRCYRNDTDKGYVPEMYVDGSLKDYIDLFLDDTLAASSFFGSENARVESGGWMSADVHLIFAVNLAKIYQDVTHRADEEARNEVVKMFQFNKQMPLVSVIWGVEKVFAEYTAWKKDDRYRNLQKFHFFRLNFTLKYQPTNNCLEPIN